MEPLERTIFIITCNHVTVGNLVAETIPWFVRIEPFAFRRLVEINRRFGTAGTVVASVTSARCGIGRNKCVHEGGYVNDCSASGRLCDAG